MGKHILDGMFFFVSSQVLCFALLPNGWESVSPSSKDTHLWNGFKNGLLGEK